MKATDEMRIQALRQASIDGAGRATATAVVSRAEEYLAFLLNGRGPKAVKRKSR